MSFFDIFKSNKKISIEQQLNTFSKLNITPKNDDFIDWIYCEWGRKAVEADPYNLILSSLGGERENGDAWERVSDDVYSFDTECVEDADIYAEILTNLAALSKDAFSITNITSTVNHENCEASISFTHNKVSYHWHLQYNNDWFDGDVINKINQLLRENDSSEFFYTCILGQNLMVLFTSQSNIDEVNKLVSIPFVLGCSEA